MGSILPTELRDWSDAVAPASFIAAAATATDASPATTLPTPSAATTTITINADALQSAASGPPPTVVVQPASAPDASPTVAPRPATSTAGSPHGDFLPATTTTMPSAAITIEEASLFYETVVASTTARVTMHDEGVAAVTCLLEPEREETRNYHQEKRDLPPCPRASSPAHTDGFYHVHSGSATTSIFPPFERVASTSFDAL